MKYPCKEAWSSGESSHCGKEYCKVFCPSSIRSDQDRGFVDKENKGDDDPDSMTFRSVGEIRTSDWEYTDTEIRLELGGNQLKDIPARLKIERS